MLINLCNIFLQLRSVLSVTNQKFSFILTSPRIRSSSGSVENGKTAANTNVKGKEIQTSNFKNISETFLQSRTK